MERLMGDKAYDEALYVYRKERRGGVF